MIRPIAFMVASVFVVSTAAIHAAERPSILLVVSDDQGYNDLGILGNGIITPALDRLAKEGTRLTNFYVAWPACTPSRASLLTGRYPQRNGIYDMIRNEAPDYGYKYSAEEYAVTFERIGGMDCREVILPAMLKPAGYNSGIYGKWDLGALKRYLPTSRGFDDFYGFVNTGIDYFQHERYGVPCMFRNLSPTEEDKGTYCTYLFQREALRFLNEHAGKHPFFLYVPFNAPHNSSALDPEIRSSVQAPEEFKKMYPPVDSETQVAAKHRYASPATVVTREARRRDYRAAVTCMDVAIGKMLHLLEDKGILDNTIVIFFSDNGGSGGADNAPLRGHKSQMWEGGVRVPCIIRWPNGDIKAGQVNDEFLTSLELFPSLAVAARTELQANVALDGFDWWSTIRGETPSPRKEMFWKRRDLIGARIGKWKWVDMGGKEGGLFDLSTDIGERKDLSDSRPEILKMVKERFADWLKEMEAAQPRGPFRDY
ncbi:sulfatase-like hydrolase/transferase [Novipirellula artificiosorum]|uniref:Arylsulfatase n=1 Tax=Novipirellula artificiosorum TaxID=2528016 RepID=A0A5C6D8E8_9BACT|nr:sulfatase-like hydrolase/transferase [Novipirellula artificiosorum]TWU32051.1 Arylsulfatase [Novipirellula artificiosorum]